MNSDGMVVTQQPAVTVELLKTDQKLDIVGKEIEDLADQTSKMMQTIEKDQDNFKVSFVRF